MVSDASKKRGAQKKAAAAAKRGGKAAAASSKAVAAETAAENGSASVDNLANGVGELQISDRTCTGVLCSHPLSRDVRVRFLICASDLTLSDYLLSGAFALILFQFCMSIDCTLPNSVYDSKGLAYYCREHLLDDFGFTC